MKKGLQILAKKSLIRFSKGMSLKPCDYYLSGKQNRMSFRIPSIRKLNVLDFVYSNVCGPIDVESLGGNKYFVTFIEDASQKVWVYFLKTKDQVFEHFKKFHAMAEREKRKPLKCLHTDNRGKYLSNEFKSNCSEKGIRHEKTVSDTPQQNGVAKKMNGTIVKKVRCMLRMANLPKSFWCEVVQTACYLINWSPFIPLEFDILKRVCTRKDIYYSHLKVFGCKAFAHVPKEQRLKLDSKAIPCIFVGYGDAKFSYKLWDLEKKKMTISQDVVFHENENLANLEKTEKTKDAIVGVPNLTPTSSSSNHAINREEVQDENLGDEPIAVDGDEPVGVDGDDAQDIEDVE